MAELNQTLEQLVGEHAEELQPLLEAGQPSVFENYDTFQVLNLRRIGISENALGFSSELYVISGENVYRYVRDDGKFLRLTHGLKDMVVRLEKSYIRNQKIITGYSDEIEKLEQSLFERSVPGYFMDMWFDLKKDLARIENFYYRNAAVYKEFFRICEKRFGSLRDDFQDIDDLIAFQNSNVLTLKTRLDSLHHYYDSIKGDRTNKTLMALTLISGVFLPLNLIVGFFGMNTEGLYFKNEPNGTQIVLIILLSIILLSLLGLPVIKFLDRHIFRFFLGRYDFYKNISRRIGKIDDHLKI